MIPGITSSRPSGSTDQGGFFFVFISRRCAMVASRIPNPRSEGSIPSTDAISLPTDRESKNDNWICHLQFPGRTRSGRYELWASGQATSFGMRGTGVRVPPARPGARRMPATGRAGAVKRALRRKSAAHPVQGAERPWLNRREHLFTKQEGAGSSPAGRAVSEAEVGDAPGRGPGGSGFESRRTPQYSATTRAGGRSTSGSGPIGERRPVQDRQVRGSSPWSRTREAAATTRTGAPERATRQAGVGHT